MYIKKKLHLELFKNWIYKKSDFLKTLYKTL